MTHMFFTGDPVRIEIPATAEVFFGTVAAAKALNITVEDKIYWLTDWAEWRDSQGHTCLIEPLDEFLYLRRAA